MSSSGLFARIAVRPGYDCPIRRLAEDGYVREFRPGRSGSTPPQIVVEPPNQDREDPLADYPIEEITWVNGDIIGRLPTVGPVFDVRERG